MDKGSKDTCRQEPGVVQPIVDPSRCEGKAACVAVCPVDVFEVVRMAPELFRTLALGAKVKVWVHGMKTAATPNASACEACGLCVAACPENAIRLSR
jgi:NAD-dependent dihydropyrimidine dehydrogenase PreA subunit